MEIVVPLLTLGALLALLLLPLALCYFLLSSAADTSSPLKRAAATNLPPSIPIFSIVAGIARLSWPSGPTLADLNLLLHCLQASRGPIAALRLPFATVIFISDGALAHQVLVNNGSAVSDRFPPAAPIRNQGSDQPTVAVAPYGEAWRSLRRNLMSLFSTPSSLKQFAGVRCWGKEKLLERFLSEAAETAGVVEFKNNFSHVFYGLVAAMCFGKKLDDKEILQLKATTESMVSVSASSIFFSFLPRFVQKTFFKLHKSGEKDRLFVNLLRGRRDLLASCYANTLVDFELPAEKEGGGGRKLTEEEIVDLCVEFFGASGHNTSIMVEWIIAELVNHRKVQERLAEELRSVMDGDKVEDGDMQRTMPYLRAVVMEGLRLHPPSSSFLRYVGNEFELGGYVVPKGAMVMFNVASMGVDEKVWEDPLEFRPERFLAAGGDAKVMAFGEGRRECAGLGLAMLHLCYFVAHLVREFEWRPAEREKVDLTGEREFFLHMKTPLRARIIRRNK